MRAALESRNPAPAHSKMRYISMEHATLLESSFDDKLRRCAMTYAAKDVISCGGAVCRQVTIAQ
jgi:hypothetical protein